MIRLLRLILSAASTTFLLTCAVEPNTSYVVPLPESTDADVVADAMATFVALRLPASSTLFLDPAPPGQTGNTVTTDFIAALRDRGFAVNEAGVMPGPHRIRYLVTPLGNGDLVRLTIDRTTGGSQFFARSPGGGLQAGGPFTVTETEATE